MRGYTSKTKIENYILQDIDGSFSEQVDEWIEFVEQYIENFTGKIFIADSVASEKIYDGEGGYKQKFDEFVDVSKVELGEDTKTEVSSDDYRIYPNNQENKHTIQLKSGIFERGYQNVTITAKWGSYASCPKDIIFAATVLASGVVNYSSNSKGKIKTRTVGKITVSYANEDQWSDLNRVEMILNKYKKFSF